MERYQISLEAENLPNTGRYFRTISPYAVVEIVEGPHRGQSLGETEPIVRSRNPDWVKIFFIDARPDIVVKFQISIWDYRGPNKEPTKIGELREPLEVISVYNSRGNIVAERIGDNGT